MNPEHPSACRVLSRAFASLVSAMVCSVLPFTASGLTRSRSTIELLQAGIEPSAGSVVFLGDWEISAFADTGNSMGEVDSQFASGTAIPAVGGLVNANAAVTYVSAASSASVGSALPVDLSGTAFSEIIIPDLATAFAFGTARAQFVNSFRITGGSGTTDAAFSARIIGSLELMTDPFGVFANADTVFSLDIFDGGSLFFSRSVGIGPNDAFLEAINEQLSGNAMLEFDKEYSILIELDSEVLALTSVPEQLGFTTPLLGIASLLVLGSRIKRAHLE